MVAPREIRPLKLGNRLSAPPPQTKKQQQNVARTPMLPMQHDSHLRKSNLTCFFIKFQVNYILGPLQLSLYRMLQDVLKFLLFFGAIFVAFVMGVRNLYSYFHSIQAEIAEHSVWNNSAVAETNHPFST